ncbi:MAG: arsenate reductase (azurin) small subunit [Planctomycetes bacterium]|nr:arsenate reductase (azurin) small subunit [Planctomycetota bacterium]
MTANSPARTVANVNDDSSCLTRRHFMLVGGIGAVTVLLGDLFGNRAFAEEGKRVGRFAAYPKKRIIAMSKLTADQPADFLYPDDGPHSTCRLYRLGTPASGGVGPGQDVVGFNTLCTHMGGTLAGSYDRVNRVAGPCPIHLTTFDLTRHGMVVAGHATQCLPQVILELDGEDVYAIGILGLIYGYPGNLTFLRGR